MPSRKHLSRYPKEYKEFFRKVGLGRVIRLEFSSETLARNFRREIYNFRLALWEDTPRPPTDSDNRLLDIADRITFKVRGNTVIASTSDQAYIETIRSTLEDLLDGT